MSTGSVNRLLNQMRKSGKLGDMKSKGTMGEVAALTALLEYNYKVGGKVFHSFKYPYASNAEGTVYLGNIIREGDTYKDITHKGLEDEIDLLYVTKYKIFVIEVKSYHATMNVSDEWITKNGTPVDKSPIWQTEKHCRHLYHQIFEYLPDGHQEYIVPIVCFVDECTIKDGRSDKYKNYIHLCVLNNLIKTIADNNDGLRYELDLNKIYGRLREIKISCEKEY